MNWYTLLELAGYIALTELAYLPLTWWLWRQRETQPCETFHATDCAEFRIHLARTQELPTTKSSTGGSTTSYVSTFLRLTGRMRFWPVS
jgi:hypothetical protein